MLDVIVLTAFGRETWLIKKLKERNLTFVSIDVTSYFKNRVVSSTAPFGMSLDKDNEDILKCGYIFNKQFQGWSAITDRGVIEANGFLREYQMHLRGDMAQRIYAHQLSTFDYPFGVLASSPQSLSVEYSTYETVMAPESLAVKKGELLAIRLREGGQFVDYKDETFKAPYLINMLDPYLCRDLLAQDVACAEMARARPMDPLYIWYPLEVSAEKTEHLSHMPKQTLILSETDKPWLEKNFIIINKQASPQNFVVWSKIIFDLKNNKNYIERIKGDILSVLQKQLKLDRITVQDHYMGLESGLSPYPIYDHQEIQKYKKWYDRGVFYCGFEVCDSFNLDEQIRVQKGVVNGLIEENQRDRQIHS